MKKSFIYIIIGLSLFSNLQGQSKFNQVSLEAGYGYSGAISPYLGQYKSDFSGFNNMNLGVRLMLSEKFGLKAELVTDKFENDPGGKIGITMTRIGVQGYYNLGKDLGLPYVWNENLGLLTHAGIGYTTLRPKFATFHERIGNLVVGITPQVKLSNRVAIFSDISYVVDIKQHYRFDGSLYSSYYKDINGLHYNFSIGLMFYLGNNNYHADWY